MNEWMHGWMHGWVGVSFLKKTHPKLPASSVKVHVLQGSNLGWNTNGKGFTHSSSQLWMGYVSSFPGICIFKTHVEYTKINIYIRYIYIRYIYI